MIYLVSVLVSFVAVFLKGFQHKNVNGNHLRMVAITSYAMAVFDVAAVSLIIQGGWPIALSSGTGAMLGMLTAIQLHDHIFGARNATRVGREPRRGLVRRRGWGKLRD